MGDPLTVFVSESASERGRDHDAEAVGDQLDTRHQRRLRKSERGRGVK